MTDDLARAIAQDADRIAQHPSMQEKGANSIVKHTLSEPVRLSVVIPYMQIDEGKPEVLENTLRTVRGADEFVIVVNWELGYARPINLGLKQAGGWYKLVMNDDMDWSGEPVSKLPDPMTVTSPAVNGKEDQKFWGCAFCLPEWVYERTGGMYEGYEISYFDDDDFQKTLESHDIEMKCVPEVKVSTQGGRTLHQFDDHQGFFYRNQQKFQQRWHNG